MSVEIPKRYGALRIVITLYQIAAALVLVGSILVGLVQLAVFADRSGLGTGLGVLSAIGTIVGGSIGALTLFALSQAISVVLDIEENTRRAALIAEARHFREVEIADRHAA